jgi:WD40 repeat protein
LGVDPIFRLQDHINIDHLEQLMNTFHLAGTGLQGYDITARTGTMDEAVTRRGYLTLMEFRQALVEILGPAIDNEQLEMLFMKVDTTCDGLVDWDEFCTYLLLQLQEMNNAHDTWTLPFDEEPSRILTNHFSKEVAVRTMFCSNPNRIITVSKDGAISTWSPDLKLQRNVVMDMDPVFSASQMLGVRRRNRLWVTDYVVMNNCNKLVVGTTSRDIWFYDVACTHYTCQYRLFDIPNVPLCFDYWYDEKNPSGTSLLLYGDDSGSVVVFYFLTPHQHLFEPSQRADDKTIQIYMQDLSHHSRYVHYNIMPAVHTDWVRQIRFMPSRNSFITCSASPINSMSIRDIERKKKAYVFKLRKGISCFDYSNTWNVIATGSVDHVVRLWNPVSTSKPMALLKGHVTSVLDVFIHEELGQVLSYSQDLTLKTWDLREYVCIQSVTWKYPTAKQPDHGASVFFLSPLASNLLVLSCNQFMAEFKLRGVGRRSLRISVTHNSSICSVLYNPLFQQVVTGCEESVVALWEIDTGQRVLQLSNVHGETELTAVAVDATGQRIFTGSRNGNIKIWNASNGHCLKNLVAKVSGEVTAILHFPEKRQVLAVGWNRILTGYTDSQETFHSGPSDSWTAGHAHKDDILTADFCPPCYLATGSFDGEIIIWTTETEKSLRRLRTVPSELTISHSDRGIISRQLDKHTGPGAHMSNVNTGLKSHHTFDRSRQVCQSTHTQSSSRSTIGFKPVYKVLFLTERSKVHGLESAILVSVDGPDAHFWQLFNSQMPTNTATGTLRVAHYEDETIHALTTDSDNKFLIAGDSSGYISVWNIEHYCINNDQASFAYPVMVHCWRAHNGIVAEVTYVGHEFCPLLVSGSDDGSVRLWNMKGHFIGTFGQGVPWNVRDPLTYQHPL